MTPIYDELELANFTDALIQLQKEFGSQLEVKWLLGGRLAEDIAKDYIGAIDHNIQAVVQVLSGK